jgi:hypothetical protein
MEEMSTKKIRNLNIVLSATLDFDFGVSKLLLSRFII